MKFLKKYNYKIALALFLVLIISFVVTGFLLLNPDISKSVYGNRINDVSKHKVANQIFDKISDELMTTKKVNKVDYNLNGRLISYVVDIVDGTTKEDARKLTDILLDNFSEDILSYYDVQVIITNKKSTNVEIKFPIIGYKHKTSDSFVWSNN